MEEKKVDKFDFMKVVDDIYSECKSEEEIALRMKQMMDCVKNQGRLSMGYLKAGILEIKNGSFQRRK